MPSEIKLWHLEEFDLFMGLSDSEKDYLKSKIQELELDKNDYVYLPQENSSNIYFLKSGRVKLGSFTDGGKKIVKAVLNPGELFGLLGLFGEDKRTDFVQALVNDVVLHTIKIRDMEPLLERNEGLKTRMIKYVIHRFDRIEKRLEAIIYKDARTRIVDFLKEMADEVGESAASETYIRNYLTHNDIANLTATSRQTVTTVLNELRAKDLIYFDRTRISIRDLTKLN